MQNEDELKIEEDIKNEKKKSRWLFSIVLGVFSVLVDITLISFIYSSGSSHSGGMINMMFKMLNSMFLAPFLAFIMLNTAIIEKQYRHYEKYPLTNYLWEKFFLVTVTIPIINLSILLVVGFVFG